MIQKELHQRLLYNPHTGEFRSNKTGKVVGWLKDGYRIIEVMGEKYRSGRLAWFYMYGIWPKTVDHKDCNPLNDKWDNLREADFVEQNHNKRVRNINQCRIKGLRVRNGRWQARIGTGFRSICIGTFATKEEAMEAHRKAALQHHGDFARWGAS